MDDDDFDWVDCIREDITPPPPAWITELKMTEDESVEYGTEWTCDVTLEYSDATTPKMEADALALKSDIDRWKVTDVKIHDTKEVSRLRIRANLEIGHGASLSELIVETITR